MVDSRLFGSRKDTMKLMTEEIERILERHPYGSQDEAGPDAKVIVKYFGGSAATWLITEGEKQRNGDWFLYGYITLGFRDDFEPDLLLWEWGSVSLKELSEVRFPPFGLPVERDLYLSPLSSTVREEAFMSRYSR